MRRISWLASVALAFAVLAACGEAPNEPPELGRLPLAKAAKGGKNACAAATVIVDNEVDLVAEVAAASPGDVIGIDGMIELSATVVVNTADITITCATEGSGLSAMAGSGIYLIRVNVDGVAVERLTLDPTDPTSAPYLAFRAANVRFANNLVTCGTGVCAFFVGTAGAQVLDNEMRFVGAPTSGIHMQGSGAWNPDGSRAFDNDGARIEGNSIVTEIPSATALFGGIRARDGSNMTIEDNTISGPWQNSIMLTNVRNSEIRKNTLEDAVRYGIGTSEISGFPFGILIDRDNSIRNNNATGAGTAGANITRACGNVLFGNNFNGNAMGVIFGAESGANTLAGNNNVVVDNGDFDCDGDTVSDPNVITGVSNVLADPNLGKIISGAASGELTEPS